MAVSALEKRMGILETKLARVKVNKSGISRSGQSNNYGMPDSLDQLAELTYEADRIKEQAEADGDFRTALAAISLMCRIVELAAKLRGELDETSRMNVLSVHLDADTAKRIAETYLSRHKTFEPETK